MLTTGPSGEQDRDQILELTQHAFGDAFAEQRAREWEWQWHEDRRLDAPGYRGIAVRDGDRIVGMTTLLPAGLFVDGQPVDACWQVCTAVHADYRRRGIGTLLQDAIASRAVFAKGMTPAVIAVLEKAGYAVLDTGGYWTRTLDLAPRLKRMAGGGAGGALGAAANVFVRSVGDVPEGVESVPGEFDERFDRLWARVAGAYPAIARRDAATLTWRYRDRPDTAYSVLALEDRGYLVFSHFDRRGIRRGRIVDLLAAPDDEEARQGLLSGALAALRLLGADRVDCFATSPVVLVSLRAAGFKRGKRPDPLAMHGTEQADPYFLAGDGDGA